MFLCVLKTSLWTRPKAAAYNWHFLRIYFSALAEFNQNAQITILHFTYLSIWRGRMMHRKLHMDTLILIPTFKICVFIFKTDGRTDERTNGQTDRQTDREINPVWAG